jgi:hypothetical protein
MTISHISAQVNPGIIFLSEVNKRNAGNQQRDLTAGRLLCLLRFGAISE